VLRLEGVFSGFPPARLAALKERIHGQKFHSVVIDASLLSRLDDMGLADLSDLELAARANGAHFAIYAATGQVGTTLEDAGLT
jgi:anti-anti-sigma regulatory factor